MQGQKFITMKNLTEEKQKSSKAYLDFLVPIKLTTTTQGEKRKKNPEESTKEVKR